MVAFQRDVGQTGETWPRFGRLVEGDVPGYAGAGGFYFLTTIAICRRSEVWRRVRGADAHEHALRDHATEWNHARHSNTRLA
jgi:hypothetical protein